MRELPRRSVQKTLGDFSEDPLKANGVNRAPELRPSFAFLTPRRSLAPSLATGVIAVFAVILFGLLVARTSSMTQADLVVSKALNSLHTGLLGSATSDAYVVFGPAPAIVGTIVIAAVILLVSRNVRLALTFGVVVAATWLPSALVKVLVHRTRPDVTLLPHPMATQPIDASYPSGHAVFVTALVVALVLLSRGHSVRPLLTVLGSVVVALVALALVIDGVHYLSDVLASIIWSLGLAPLVLELWNRLVLPRTYRRSAERAASE